MVVAEGTYSLMLTIHLWGNADMADIARFGLLIAVLSKIQVL
jgi:hypothetical protein